MSSERSAAAEDYGDIQISNGFPEPQPPPPPPPDPVEEAHAHRIRADVNDTSPTALHEKYNALLATQSRQILQLTNEAIKARQQAADQEIAAKKAAAEREVAALDENLKKRREDLELMLATLGAVEESAARSVLAALNDKAQIFQVLRAPKKEAPTGGELAVDSFKYVIDAARDVLKGNPALLSPVGKLFEKLSEEAATAQAGEANTGKQAEAVDFAKMPLGELFERGRALAPELRGGREPEDMPMRELVELLVKVHASAA